MSGESSGAGVRGARSKSGFVSFLKSILVGGLAFLLPFGVIMIVIGKLFEVFDPIGDAVRARLLPNAASELGGRVFTILFLIALAFAAGLFVRSRVGRVAFEWLENSVLMRLPPYMLLRQTIHDQTEGSNAAAGNHSDEVVLVRLDDATSIGFVVERLPEGNVVVYLPGAPSPFSGNVAIIEESRLTPTKLSVADVFVRMRQLGAGLDRSLQRS